MKWETHGQKQTMEDTRKGKQAKESATTAEADWWLKTDELGDRYLNPEKDGTVRETWWETSECKEKTSGQPDTTRRREPDWETSKERPVKTGIQRPEAIGQSGRHKGDGGR